MNPITTGSAEAGASFFENFIVAHPVVTCILLAWLISWVVTLGVHQVLRDVLPDRLERTLIRFFDCLLASVAVFEMWPVDKPFPLWWALGIGFSSPIAYLALSELVSWKWPVARKYFSLYNLDTEPTRPPAPPSGPDNDNETGV